MLSYSIRVATTYWDSMDDKATIDCFFDFQEIAVSFGKFHACHYSH